MVQVSEGKGINRNKQTAVKETPRVCIAKKEGHMPRGIQVSINPTKAPTR
jgi:hypothetical protein